ncbi:hypothetical protein [Luteibacter sp. 22Crub2.1]|uniref:hypothetical protein n=1 Tax=Luteibacter sp. 22Crub2.1 TaxID=1283288 RepID=UPI0009A56957|nr:hypothetical protein [Luteibacter sp. 22Crub2.1]
MTELQHTDIVGKDSSFNYGVLHGRLTGIFEVGFSRLGYDYTVYRQTDMQSGTTARGVRVHAKGSDSLHDIPCDGEFNDTNFNAVTDVPCDSNKVVGCSFEKNEYHRYLL